jgi:uncharacterized protein YidB (DUF937 family)
MTSYFDRQIQEANERQRHLSEGRGDASESAKIYVEPAQRRAVEAFADSMRDLGTPEDAQPEALDYARMDASAMLSRLAGGDQHLLEELQSAIMQKNMWMFVDALDRAGVGSRSDRLKLRMYVGKGDREAIAASIRILGQGALEQLKQQLGTDPAVGIEVANPSYPLMGTNRRMRQTVYLTGSNDNDPISFRRPPNAKERPPVVYTATELGDDAADWEFKTEFHAYLLDGINAAENLMLEAKNEGMLDGRCLEPWGGGYAPRNPYYA